MTRMTLWQRLTRPFRRTRPVRVEWIAAELLARGFNLTDITACGDWQVAYEAEEADIVEAILAAPGQGRRTIEPSDVRRPR